MMTNDIRIALVTGANKGIGFSTARQLLKMGYRVYLGARDMVKGQAAVKQLNKEGFSEALSLELDVANGLSIKSAAEMFGRSEKQLDVLINNAAIGGEQPQQTSSIKIALLKEVFETNYFGAILVTHAFLPFMSASNNPRIVNVSSELGSLSFQARAKDGFYANNLMAYSATKVALNSFTVLLANEFQHTNFKVNSVTPGYTSTDLTSFSGGHSPEKAAIVIVKYATLDKSGPTGQFVSETGAVSW